MNLRHFSAIILCLALSSAAGAQNAAPPPDAQAPPNGPTGGFGQRGGIGAMGGSGVTGSVTEMAADHFTIKTQTGETYTVHFSANTRFLKQMAGAGGANPGNSSPGENRARNQRNPQNQGQNGNQNRGQARMAGGGPAQPIKATDIKVGDAIAAMGEIDSAAKSVGAMAILLLDPERARQMQQMEANFGKTWLMGKVTAINDVQVTLDGSVDNAPHTFVADENTAFRERRNPLTLADIHIGDTVRVDGAIKDGTFTATTVNVMSAPADATRVPRNAPPSQ